MSLLYLPYREIGIITCDCRPQVSRLGNENFLTLSIGNSFQVMRVDKLSTCLISKPCEEEIVHLATKNSMTFVATKSNKIVKFKRADIVCELGYHEYPIVGLHNIGDVLVSADNSNNIQVFDSKQNTRLSSLKSLNTGCLTVSCHPPTYVNKFLFGFSNGELELWNIRTGKHLYSFQSHLASLLNDENKDASVSSITPAPSCDIMAVGHNNGHIFIINIKIDQVLFHFKQVGKVTDLSFRTDSASDKCPFLVSSSSHGHLYTWKIGGGMNADGTFLSKSSKLVSTQKRAHDGQIQSSQFLHGEPILVTTGSDNSVKVWIYDNHDGSPRLLRSRIGHSNSAQNVSFFGDVSYDSQFGHGVSRIASGLVSCDGNGHLMFTRIDRYGLMEKFSTSALDKSSFLHGKPLPAVAAYDMIFQSANSWGNIVTIHRNSTFACMWKVENKAATSTVLSIPASFLNKSQQHIYCSSVACSPCGNFAIVGYNNGWVCKYNMQSGIFRGTFPLETLKSHINIIDRDAREKVSTSVEQVHENSICGIFIDGMNSVVVSADTSGLVCFWSFLEHKVLKREHFSSGIEHFVGHRDTNFVAIATKDHSIRVFDLFSLRLIRAFVGGHSSCVKSLSFSPDGRRLLSSCENHQLRVWDMATGRCLSWMQFSSTVNSTCFSPNGDLILARDGERGLLMAVDRSLTDEFTANEEPSRPLDCTKQASIDMSSDYAFDQLAVDEVHEIAEDAPLILTSGSATVQLSEMPKAYWSKIFKFESLKKKKTFAEPIKKVSTPFFLGPQNTVEEVNIASKDPTESTSLSRLVRFRDVPSSRLVTFLESGPKYGEVLSFLTALNPSEIESEFRMLCPFEGNYRTLCQLSNMLQSFESLLKEKVSFEVIQAYLHCLLSIHSGKVMKSFSMKNQVLRLSTELKISSDRLHCLLHSCLCLIKIHLEIQLL